MDFEAWWAKQNSITLRMAMPKATARAAYNQGRIDTKKECIELCHSGKIKMSDFFPDRLAEEIEKL